MIPLYKRKKKKLLTIKITPEEAYLIHLCVDMALMMQCKILVVNNLYDKIVFDAPNHVLAGLIADVHWLDQETMFLGQEEGDGLDERYRKEIHARYVKFWQLADATFKRLHL